MKDDTTDPVVRNTITDLLKRGMSMIGSKIFQEDDDRAHHQGWQIIQRHGGLSRTYRDARFDYLIRCVACSGCGCVPHGADCPDCGGTGRVALGSADAARFTQGQS